MDKEIELKKLEIEKLKVLEGYMMRSLILILLTVGAGIGTIISWIGIEKTWLYYILTILLIVFFVFGVIFITVLITFNKELKKVKRWIS